MTLELSAVYEELLRLKAEGAERVYLADATLELLKPKPRPQPKQAELSQELQSLVENTSSSPTKTNGQSASETRRR